MALLLGIAAVVVVLAFFAWLHHGRLPFRRTLRQIRELPEHVHDRVRKP